MSAAPLTAPGRTIRIRDGRRRDLPGLRLPLRRPDRDRRRRAGRRGSVGLRDGQDWFLARDADAPAAAGGRRRSAGRDRGGDRAGGRDPGGAKAPVVWGLTRDVDRDRPRDARLADVLGAKVDPRPLRARPGPGRRVSRPGEGLGDPGRGQEPGRPGRLLGGRPADDAPQALGAVLRRAQGPVRAGRAGRADRRRGRPRTDGHLGEGRPVRSGSRSTVSVETLTMLRMLLRRGRARSAGRPPALEDLAARHESRPIRGVVFSTGDAESGGAPGRAGRRRRGWSGT